MKKPTIPVKFPVPLEKSVIIEKIKKETKENDLIIFEGADDNNIGRIMAVADDCNPKLRPGLKVVFSKHADRTIRFDGNYYLLMHQMDVFCIMPEEAVLMPEAKPLKEQGREKGIVQYDAELKRRSVKEQNGLDKVSEMRKKLKK